MFFLFFPSHFDKFLVEFLANNLYPRVWNIFSVMTDRMSIAVKPIGRKIRERRDFMSLLQGILTRLVSLQEQAESGEVAQRYFDGKKYLQRYKKAMKPSFQFVGSICR